MSSITKLLVANRGEIARRVFSTARRMGIATVAVFSDPDRDAPFVRDADEGVALGGATPAESYLRGDAIIEAALRTGADALHPGYGFLAENADFARSVADAGLIWVGPSPAAIETMGSKLASKDLMEQTGVPILSSVDLTGVSDDDAASAAAGIGYPVLVKASAGGGGKGMRIVSDATGLADAVAGAKREAGAAFGDDTVFLEKYLEAPRHIEIQIFGDSHGNIVSFFERECSIQRRHQKIIEEAPSPVIDAGTRQRMGDAAVAAARSVEYVGAGTVEFLFQDGNFFFLEMNTRLQVEHPVTELVTGLDLVRLQLLVAGGDSLPYEALNPTITGHAIEARLYAEDAEQGFLPVTGTLTDFAFEPLDGLRVDTGVEAGSVISVHYDPMLAKVIMWAPSRTEAALKLARALERASIWGSVTNRALLVRSLRHPEFLEGGIDTHFLNRHDPVDLGRPLVDSDGEWRAAVAVAISDQAVRHGNSPVLATVPSGWRNVASQVQQVTFTGRHGVHEVGYRFTRTGDLEVEGATTATLVETGPERVGIELDGRLGWYRIHRAGGTTSVIGPDGPVVLREVPRFPIVEVAQAPGSLVAPMPGKVLRVAVEEGDAVELGQVIVVMEAMKMEHTLRAPHAGVVARLAASPGDQVEADAVLAIVDES